MKSSTIALILSLTATALGKRDALADCGANQACVTVVTAINGWTGSVNTVNQFLNNPTALAPNVALGAANLEPGFLTTLGGTSSLDAAGQQAA